jgi:hypothetical protein
VDSFEVFGLKPNPKKDFIEKRFFKKNSPVFVQGYFLIIF